LIFDFFRLPKPPEVRVLTEDIIVGNEEKFVDCLSQKQAD